MKTNARVGQDATGQDATGQGEIATTKVIIGI